ncbi:hypothetical protein BCV70DRAFT_114450 [Testicularia cyperi]|uniref:Uncharacterized protein n=1 Tax=Testicularia cyperi TaxID=1882483 RepID=A0A317XNK7_9BASI|nr:hypothetical protein BCV70DRAFT_114450 [Testicularia cyperi]
MSRMYLKGVRAQKDFTVVTWARISVATISKIVVRSQQVCVFVCSRRLHSEVGLRDNLQLFPARRHWCGPHSTLTCLLWRQNYRLPDLRRKLQVWGAEMRRGLECKNTRWGIDANCLRYRRYEIQGRVGHFPPLRHRRGNSSWYCVRLHCLPTHLTEKSELKASVCHGRDGSHLTCRCRGKLRVTSP